MKIIVTEEAIRQRVAEMGAEITRFYADDPAPLLVAAVLNGGMFFCADLAREIKLPQLMIDSLAASSYCHDASTGRVTFTKEPKNSVKAKNVLLVDDVLDTGLTIRECAKRLMNMGAKSVRAAVIAKKQLPEPPEFTAEWVGFELPDLYLIGYGLDSEELYRNLPFIAVDDGDGKVF